MVSYKQKLERIAWGRRAAAATPLTGVPAVEQDEMKRKSVMEGKSVTSGTCVKKTPNNSITWYFNDILLAEITGDRSKIGADVQCDAAGRNRLQLDNQTGSLTSTNTRITDSGQYKLEIRSSRFSFIRSFSVSATNGEPVSVSVMEGDSIILKSGIKTHLQENIRWIFNDTLIAEITGDQSKICTDVQCDDADERFRERLKVNHQTGSLTIMNITNTDIGCYKLQIIRERIHEKPFSVPVNGDVQKICTDKQCKEKFRDRLKVNNQTGSLTITNTKTTDSGLYKLQIISSRISIKRSFSVNVAGWVLVSKKEGDSVIINTGVKTNQKEKIQWYFIDTLIAEITGDLRKICTNVCCQERFRDRLNVDEFGSLTIMNIITKDAGVYKLKINGSLVKIFSVSIASFSVGSDEVSVKEGVDSVTLHTDVERNQQKDIIWRFNDSLIAEISGDLSYICSDIQCNTNTERFRGRLKLDNQTGSLTITNINTTDSGIFKLQIINNNSRSIQRNVSITVTGVSADEQEKMKRKSVKEGESVTLDTIVIISKPNNLLWLFNETCIAEINGAQSKIGTKDQEDLRLAVDRQTGSLTIKNTKITDSGVYKLQITSNSVIRITSVKSYSVTVTDIKTQRRHQANGDEDSFLDQTDAALANTSYEMRAKHPPPSPTLPFATVLTLGREFFTQNRTMLPNQTVC
ncbi:Immunoglobulin superfamily member 10 [Labeo rohita]|nr:Immunoglobulin superfamily member 10 [Labeo rohita]